MAELVNVRCGQGHLILTDTYIIIERLGKSQMMARSAFTSLDAK